MSIRQGAAINICGVSDTERAQRDRLEQLQAELRALVPERDAVRARLAEARRGCAEARAREREAARQYAASLFGAGALTTGLLAWRRGALGAARFALISLIVVAVFGTVLGTVTLAIQAHRAHIEKRLRAPE